jgi:oligopeptide/dipeptide ABC transporter ATP-binding protein
MANKLEVRNLRISFRTVSGKLQAVRDISFELKDGETLAIVGESGSGKSVTSKAILGILAGNAIIDGGEIIYDGRDLLKIPEDEFYKIRGDKIAMIFQDPLSSLNPIMRVGKQLTEAMILKGKARQKACRKAFNDYLALLEKAMIKSSAAGDPAKAKSISEKCRNFNTFEITHLKLETAYNNATNNAKEAIDEIENALFLIDKNAFKDEKNIITNICDLSLGSINDYVVCEDAEELRALVSLLKKNVPVTLKSADFSDMTANLTRLKEILQKAIEKEMPNFFSMGYYNTFSGEKLPDLPVGELNKFLRRYLDDNYMLEFIDNVKIALKDSAEEHLLKKASVVNELKDSLSVFGGEEYVRSEIDALTNMLVKSVHESIDPLEINKDSAAHTFESSLRSAVDVYFKGEKQNVVETKRYARQKAAYDKKAAKTGGELSWKVTPAAIVDLQLAKDNICKIITRLCEHYEEQLANKDQRNYDDEAVAVIDYLKFNASGFANKVTRRMAKLRALKLMEEVGIPEPRKRYKQYPFEFSGGMRQRIVIAIALAANPDILICDEPTTALDVTIQAQILELINKLKKERNLSIIFITHDLGVVANMADKIAVMYAGKIVEYGTSRDVFYSPAHPYTWALLSSMPDLDTNEKLEAIPGTPPNMIYPPVGDAFAERNRYALKIDFEKQPPMFRISDTHSAATWLLHPDAPHVDPPRIVTERIARSRKNAGGANND